MGAEVEISKEANDAVVAAWSAVANTWHAMSNRDAYVGSMMAKAAEDAVRAAAPLILAAERERLLPELEFLFEHADDYVVPGALRKILAGTWDLDEARRIADRRASELRGED